MDILYCPCINLSVAHQPLYTLYLLMCKINCETYMAYFLENISINLSALPGKYAVVQQIFTEGFQATMEMIIIMEPHIARLLINMHLRSYWSFINFDISTNQASFISTLSYITCTLPTTSGLECFHTFTGSG